MSDEHQHGGGISVGLVGKCLAQSRGDAKVSAEDLRVEALADLLIGPARSELV